MNIKLLSLLTLSLGIFFGASNAFASGGESDDGGSEEEFDTSAYGRPSQPVVDPAYEAGKAVYTGRKSNAPKISYCLKEGDELVKLKRKTIKPHKKGSYSSLAASLYNCDTNSFVKEELARQDFIHVLYYLDKRYKLKLERS